MFSPAQGEPLVAAGQSKRYRPTFNRGTAPKGLNSPTGGSSGTGLPPPNIGFSFSPGVGPTGNTDGSGKPYPLPPPGGGGPPPFPPPLPPAPPAGAAPPPAPAPPSPPGGPPRGPPPGQGASPASPAGPVLSSETLRSSAGPPLRAA